MYTKKRATKKASEVQTTKKQKKKDKTEKGKFMGQDE